MTKNEFTKVLKSKINHLPKSERRKILQYYYEMISERMEDGMTEAEAIDALGNIDELLSEYSPAPSEPRRGVRLRAWHIIMLIIGAPLWISLVAAMLCIMLAFYIIIWVLVICFYVVFAALAASGFALTMASFLSFFYGGAPYFFLLFGAGAFLSGLAIMWLIVCNLFAKAMAKVTGKSAKGIFRFFFKRR
ncbi:MAG: DUF1700 domain-containing protein [Clostridia bacterium]|nr:DUF1700 domain-containing protein [Clostridia bacterium]